MTREIGQYLMKRIEKIDGTVVYVMVPKISQEPIDRISQINNKLQKLTDADNVILDKQVGSAPIKIDGTGMYHLGSTETVDHSEE